MSFCFPVKYGWQRAQISTWIAGTVERVMKLFPQAQFTVARWYLG